MPVSPYEKCKKRKPKGRDNWYQCTRKVGHEGEHTDSKSIPVGRWKEPEE